VGGVKNVGVLAEVGRADSAVPLGGGVASGVALQALSTSAETVKARRPDVMRRDRCMAPA